MAYFIIGSCHKITSQPEGRQSTYALQQLRVILITLALVGVLKDERVCGIVRYKPQLD